VDKVVGVACQCPSFTFPHILTILIKQTFAYGFLFSFAFVTILVLSVRKWSKPYLKNQVRKLIWCPCINLSPFSDFTRENLFSTMIKFLGDL
jgi:hypothetical protein